MKTVRPSGGLWKSHQVSCHYSLSLHNPEVEHRHLSLSCNLWQLLISLPKFDILEALEATKSLKESTLEARLVWHTEFLCVGITTSICMWTLAFQLLKL